jgi:hypothetical protein
MLSAWLRPVRDRPPHRPTAQVCKPTSRKTAGRI